MEGEWTNWKVIQVKDDTSPYSLNFIVSLIAIFIVSVLLSCGIYSYRSFSCLRKGDDTIYLMSELDRGQNEDKMEADFFPVDFSRNHPRDHSSTLEDE